MPASHLDALLVKRVALVALARVRVEHVVTDRADQPRGNSFVAQPRGERRGRKHWAAWRGERRHLGERDDGGAHFGDGAIVVAIRKVRRGFRRWIGRLVA
jgi:hypothetical protein